MTRSRRCLPCLPLLPFLAVTLHAAAQPTLPTFEVASVKTSRSKDGPIVQVPEGTDSASWRNMPLGALVATAYGLKDPQVFGPAWVRTERFDVVARSSGPATAAEKRLMLRSLLRDRFTLQLHVETRTVPAYSLELAAQNGRPGHGLRRSNADCTSLASPCGVVDPTPAGEFQMRAGTIDVLVARGLSPAVQALVVDNTGLSGLFDVTLKWLPQNRLPGSDPKPNPEDRTSIYTAVQEQLGLKLVVRPAQVEVVFIDQAERPTPD